MSGFKDYDKVLSEIYGYLDPSYDFNYLTNCILTLKNLINVSDDVSNPQEYLAVLAQLFEQANFDKLQNVLDVLFADIEKKKIDYIQLQNDNNKVKDFIDTVLINPFLI